MVCTAQLLSFLKSYDFISDKHLEEHSEEESLGNFSHTLRPQGFL